MKGLRSRWYALVPGAVLLVLVGLLWIGMQKGDPPLPSPLIGKPAPALPEVPVGQAAEELAQGEPVLVNFWASWCQPCLAEHPLLMDLSRRGVRIIGINYKDEPAAAQRWLEHHGNPFARVLTDDMGQHAIDWGVYGVPETYLMDAEGVIVAKHVGALDARFLERPEVKSRLGMTP